MKEAILEEWKWIFLYWCFWEEYGKYKAQNFAFHRAMWHNPWEDVKRQRKITTFLEAILKFKTMGSCDRHCICILCLLNGDSLFSASVNWYRLSRKLESGHVDQCWSRPRFIPSWISTTGSELRSLLLKMSTKGRMRARSSKTIARKSFQSGNLPVGRKYSKRNLFQTAKSTRRKVQS